MNIILNPSYALRKQQRYCCVPTCIQMVLARRGMRVPGQEEIGIDLGLIVPPEDIYLFKRVPTGEKPSSGWGTRIDTKRYGLNNFFEKNNIPLKSRFYSLDDMDNVPGFIENNISADNDILVCYRYGVVYGKKAPYGHGSLIEGIDQSKGKAIRLVDPHGSRKDVPIDILTKAIYEHRQRDRALGGFWVIGRK